MRIAWLTPWAEGSAIGRFSSLVVTELRRAPGVAVDVWYPAGAGGRTVPDAGHQVDGNTAAALREYDAVVYNMGNHIGYHGGIYELSLQVPGVVVLHDVVLTHVFLPELLRRTEAAMRRTMSRWYGAAGAAEVQTMRSDPAGWLWAEGNLERFPMLQPVLEGAELVITHSTAAAGVVAPLFVGDVEVLKLPSLHWPDEVPSRAALPLLDSRPVVLQAGAVNPNKFVGTVVAAFADPDVRSHFQLVVAGHVPPADNQKLDVLIRDLGLEDSVQVLGAVDDATMQALRHRAVVATVLRYPVTESSSAVLVDSMAHGLAPIALPVGHYREHPADVVHFVPTPPTAEGVAARLAAWGHDPDEVTARGAAARSYAERHHRADRYAAALLAELEHRRSAVRRRALAAGAAELVTRNGFPLDGPLSGRVAEEAAALFGTVPRHGRP